MFTNESTENLLDNLENELTEVIELENPEVIETTNEKMQPIPAKRSFTESENLATPVPMARRRLHSLDKSEKNDENEIIQMSSVSSSSVSENRKNISQNTVVARHREMKSTNHKVMVVQEVEAAQSEEKSYVTKHGKWAQNENAQSDIDESIAVETELNEPTAMSDPRKDYQKPHFEVFSETQANPTVKHQKSKSTSSPSHTSLESSSESSSSSEESLKTRKKLKEKQKEKQKKKSKKKKKLSSEDPSSSAESSVTNSKEKTLSDQAIGKVILIQLSADLNKSFLF